MVSWFISMRPIKKYRGFYFVNIEFIIQIYWSRNKSKQVKDPIGRRQTKQKIIIPMLVHSRSIKHISGDLIQVFLLTLSLLQSMLFNLLIFMISIKKWMRVQSCVWWIDWIISILYSIWLDHVLFQTKTNTSFLWFA